MKYKPSIKEVTEVETYAPQVRLHYFLTRVIESEEVWGLANASGWVMEDVDKQLLLPIWPYEKLALDCKANKWEKYHANAISLEHFIYNILPTIIKQHIKLEILPTKTTQGIVLAGTELSTILETMLESGEYYMEG